MRKNFNVLSTAVAVAAASSMIAGGVVLAQSTDSPASQNGSSASADARNPDAPNTQVDTLNYSSGVKRDSRMAMDSPSRGMVGSGKAGTSASAQNNGSNASSAGASTGAYAANGGTAGSTNDASSTSPTSGTSGSSGASNGTLAPRADRN